MTGEHKISKTSAVDMICEKVKGFIREGTWPAGNKIPPELELAQLFDVNRMTVRIALQKLNALGILETRIGDGTYVSVFDFDHHIHEISEFYTTAQTLDNVKEFREIVQLQSIRLAIQRYGEEELVLLRDGCASFEEEVVRFYSLEDTQKRNQSRMRTVELSLAYQSQLCKMSHNDLLYYSFSVAKEPIRQHMLLNALRRVEGYKSAQANPWVREHWSLFDGVTARDFDKCSYHMKRIIYA